jgi:excisionase family DNA binding protein
VAPIPTTPTLGTALRYAAEQLINAADQADRDTLPELLTTGQVAAQFQVSNQTVRRWIKAGELEAVKVGDVYRVPIESVRALFEARA